MVYETPLSESKRYGNLASGPVDSGIITMFKDEGNKFHLRGTLEPSSSRKD